MHSSVHGVPRLEEIVWAFINGRLCRVADFVRFAEQEDMDRSLLAHDMCNHRTTSGAITLGTGRQ